MSLTQYLESDGINRTAVSVANPLPVLASIDTGDLATDASVQDVTAEVAGLRADLAVPASSVPHEALDATSDLTRVYDDGSTAAEESLVGATASQTTRVHRIIATADAACNIELRDGSGGTVLRKLHFPAAGGYVLDFNARPWAVTTANTALYWYRSAAVACTIEADYVKSA